MDKNDKEKFINLVDELGLNVSTAIARENQVYSQYFSLELLLRKLNRL